MILANCKRYTKKVIFFILAVLFLNGSLMAQCGIDDYGQMIPYAMCSKYKNLIDTSKVKACYLKNYNNDSLYSQANKNTMGDGKIVGFAIDTLINLKAVASKYKIKEGTVWLYKIESKTAKMLDIQIDHLDLPEGAYICLFPKQSILKLRGPRTYTKKNIQCPAFRKDVYGNQLFIEYFEPNIVGKNTNIIISSIGYTYASPLKKR